MTLACLANARWKAAVLLCLSACVAAQYQDPYYNNSRTPGRIIAGIVAAICIAILFLCLFSVQAVRRRRRGLTVLPSYRVGYWGNSQPQNQNQSPYLAYPMANNQRQQSWGGGYQPPSGSPPQDEFVPPPPYPGKPKDYDGEQNSGYGYPNAPDQGSPNPGGFVASDRPSSPPAAHVNTNSPWFRSG